MVVQHNISAMNANRYYTMNNSALGKSLEKLSSGYAINRAGDNAAGLAVSEKMRAQIAGMTQASKNAQDGISMVQTFEGALQETDSILQRMRTLAVQSANGSYANEVDREAIQLEYDQLNDELNAIADTDFNGVVMLNGGTMADGLEAVSGKFDYANKKTQVQDKVTTALSKNVEAAKINLDKVTSEQKTLVNNAKNALDGAFDLSESVGSVWNTLDNNKYTVSAANELWDAMDLSLIAPASTEEKFKADELEVTFTYMEDDANPGSYIWKATSATAYSDGEKVATSEDGDVYDKTVGKMKWDNIEKLTATAAPEGSGATATTGKGGFTVALTGASAPNNEADTYGNAIFDALDVTPGSTVTLKYTNNNGGAKAPNNYGFAEDSVVLKKGDDATTSPTLSVAKGDVVDATMTEEIGEALEGLNGFTIETKYSADGTAVDLIFGDKNSIDAYESAVAQFNEATAGGNANEIAEATAAKTEAEKNVVIAKVGKVGAASATGTASTLEAENSDVNGGKLITTGTNGGLKFTTTDENGNEHVYFAQIENGTDSSKIDIYDSKENTNSYGVVTGYSKGTNKLMSIGIEDLSTISGTTTTLKNASAKATVSLDKGTYTAGSKPTLTTADDPNLSSKDTAVKNYNKALETQKTAVANAQKALDDAKAGLASVTGNVNDEKVWKNVQNEYSKLQSSSGAKVSVSDNYDNSAAKMTYAKDMELQVGARTKDIVKFNFQYTSDGLGDLEADLNASARGLGTDKLSLLDQKSANDAIDKIDNALNKISMIRGTFGAIQNRLEHKITNLDTNVENLTAAESRIRDTQMDQEMMKFTSSQILSQASQSMLAQANSLPQGVLQLLG